jgi:predicted dehydrogenase
MLRVGLLGFGFMGQTHFDRYQRISEAKVTAIADAQADRLTGQGQTRGNLDLAVKGADLTRVSTYADAGALIAQEDVDIIDVCLPTFLHSRFTVAALEAGRDVLCEKPMATNLEEADAMLDAAARTGKTLMIAQCVRFWPEYVFLAEMIESGKWGDLCGLRFFRHSLAPNWSWDNWMRNAQKSGGTILDLHIHDVDVARYILGMPRALYAQGGQLGITAGYDFVDASFVYDQIPRVNIEAACLWEGPGFEAGYDAIFEASLLCYRANQEPTLSLYGKGETEASHPEVPDDDAYTREIAYFCACVQEGKPPRKGDPVSARDSVALVLAEKESIRTKSLVHV